jgi:tRNA (guanine37-N1)-methyltransferase
METNNIDFPEWILEVQKTHGSVILNWLRSESLLDHRWKVRSKDHLLFIPLSSSPSIIPPLISEKNVRIYSAEEFRNFFSPIHFHSNPTTGGLLLRDAVKSFVPADLLPLVPRSFDAIGDIAILELNRNEQTLLEPFIIQIAQTLLDSHHEFRAVFGKAGDVDGVFRVRSLRHLAGDPTPITIHRENNCAFRVNIQETFFTPRLVFERKRLAEYPQIWPQDSIIWDMFCGVGPYTIQIAKKSPSSPIIATDINEIAIKLLHENLQLNKIPSKIDCYVQDLGSVQNNPHFHQYFGKVGRFLMNLPERNLEFLPQIPPFIHPKGALLHIYQFNAKYRPIDEAIERFTASVTSQMFKIRQILSGRIVKPFSPSKDTTVLDILIDPI